METKYNEWVTYNNCRAIYLYIRDETYGECNEPGSKVHYEVYYRIVS